MLHLGLNDEGMHEFPQDLHVYCGQGLRIWQFPLQFSRYMEALIALEVRSYLGIGIRHGGSFVASVEILERFRQLDFAVAVDVIPCPSLLEYACLNPRTRIAWLNTQSPAFDALVDDLKDIDLVFIDSHHHETQCRNEFESIKAAAKIIAFHDIANVGCPGVGRVWREICASGDYNCEEFVEQYEPGKGPYMGIGLAVAKNRVPPAPAGRSS